MDEYLRLLYDHLMENLLSSAYLNARGYRRQREALDLAWDALRESLTPEQLGLSEAFHAASCDLQALEDEALFQEAVALGKWMALS